MTMLADTYPFVALAAIITDGDTDKLGELLERATDDRDPPFEQGMEWVTKPELIALRAYIRRGGNIRLAERINDVLKRGLPAASIRNYWLESKQDGNEVQL